jgi:mRNA-degrading endonuclease RelE of RelBE toxin-antitoxin system
MAYAVVLTKDIRKQSEQLPGYVKTQVKALLLTLPDQPRPPQSKELVGHPDYYRIWIGATYRVIWFVSDEDKIIEPQYVGPKTPELYRVLGLERPTAAADADEC